SPPPPHLWINSVDDLFRPDADHGLFEGVVMTYLPARPDLEQLRHQAKDLLRGATRGEAEGLARSRAVCDRRILASAQLAIAREYGFESWPRLEREVERRGVLNGRDLDRLSALLAEAPALAVSPMV